MGRLGSGALLAAAFAFAAPALASDVESGPATGQRLGAFPVINVTGQQAEGLAQDDRDELCYR